MSLSQREANKNMAPVDFSPSVLAAALRDGCSDMLSNVVPGRLCDFRRFRDKIDRANQK